jgi:hypothetical protein
MTMMMMNAGFTPHTTFFSGIFGVPRDIVGAAMYHAVISFERRLAAMSKENRFLEQVNFVIIDSDLTKDLISMFKSLHKEHIAHKLSHSMTSNMTNTVQSSLSVESETQQRTNAPLETGITNCFYDKKSNINQTAFST